MRVDVAITIWPRFPERVDYLMQSVAAFHKFAKLGSLDVAYVVGCETEKSDPAEVQRVLSYCCHSGISYLPNEGEAHLGRNMNNLMAFSQAPYLFYLQEDFELLREIDLVAGVEFMEQNPDVDVVRYHWRAPEEHLITAADPDFTLITNHSKKNLDFHPRLQRKSFTERFGAYTTKGSAEIGMSGRIRKDLHDKVKIAACEDCRTRTGLPAVFTHIGHQTSMLEKYKMHRIDDHIGKPANQIRFPDATPVHTTECSPLRRWAFGITAAPESATLEPCLINAIKAGFTRPYVFADEAVERPAVTEGPFYFQARCRPYGETANTIWALNEMLLHQPGAQAFCITPSDAVLMPRTQIKLFLERSLWPAEDIAFLVLNASTPKSGWQQLTSEHWPERAAYVFPRHVLIEMLEDDHIRKLSHRKKAELKHAFFNWAGRTKRRVFCTSPHLATVVGDNSSDNYLGDLVKPLV